MSSAPLDVALLNFGYWPEVRRGSERVVHDLAIGLASGGHRTRIVTSHPGRRTRSFENGVEVVRNWRPPDALPRRRRFQENLTHVPFSYLELRRKSPDVAHAFFLTDGMAAARWSRQQGRPAVFSFMGIPGRENLSNLRLRLRAVQAVLRDSAALTVLSKAAGAGARRWLGVEPRVINPGVALDRFGPGKRPASPTIACAASPDDARKRVSLLVRAFGRVRKDRPDARLALMRPADPAAAAELAQVGGVELWDPSVDNAAEMFQAASISALCSLREAFGLVLVESLACGTPVVGSRDGAIPEIIDRPEVGRLFEGEEEGALATAILETLELAGDERTADHCRARAEDFSIDRCVAAHEDLYRELLAR